MARLFDMDDAILPPEERWLRRFWAAGRSVGLMERRKDRVSARRGNSLMSPLVGYGVPKAEASQVWGKERKTEAKCRRFSCRSSWT